MSTNAPSRRSRRAGSTDATTTDSTTPDATAADSTAADATAGPDTGAAALDAVDGDVAPAVDDASAGMVAGEGVSWSDAIVWLALQVGTRPTMSEVTSAEAVWAALHAAPGVSARRLVADAEDRGVALDAAAVDRVLVRFGRVGIARSSVEGSVTRYWPVSPAEIVTEAQKAATTAASGATVAARITSGGGAALPPGGLRAAVAAHLAEHAEQRWTPHAIAKVLGNSSGAIAKVCERLTSDGIVVLTADRPRTYQHAATPTDGAIDGAETTDGAEVTSGADAAAQ